MTLPKRKFVKRDREYNLCDTSQINQIVKGYLFDKSSSHRKLDETILGLNSEHSKGYQSMGVLHFLGLNGEFKGIFYDQTVSDAVKILAQADEEFYDIIELIGDSSLLDEQVLHSLLADTKTRIEECDFDALNRSLAELEETDSKAATSARKEQAILRKLMIGTKRNIQCVLCHKIVPTSLIVTAHILPRAHCSVKQRKNPNIVMPVCKIGCDALFEDGYLEVHETGKICKTKTLTILDDLKDVLALYKNKQCLAYTEDTSEFFKQKLTILKQKQGIECNHHSD